MCLCVCVSEEIVRMHTLSVGCASAAIGNFMGKLENQIRIGLPRSTRGDKRKAQANSNLEYFSSQLNVIYYADTNQTDEFIDCLVGK